MDEALRRAYLAAMDVPVWLPRDAPEFHEAPAARDAAARLPPQHDAPRQVDSSAPGRVAATGGRRAHALLGEGPGERSTASRPPGPRPPSKGRTRAGADGQTTLVLVRVGATLFIDEAGPGRPDPDVRQLLGSLAFVLERERLVPDLQALRWPPAGGVADGPEQARDFLLARIQRIADDAPLERLVLMGGMPAQLLGADAERPSDTGDGPERLPGLEVRVVRIPAAAQMLAHPDLKRRAWQVLRLLALPRD